MTLALMCGLSFAGKSTFAAVLADALDAAVVSLDGINAERGLDGGQGIPLDEWAVTNRMAHERVGSMLADGRHVVVDDTGSPRFIRDGWRSVADVAAAPFVIVYVRVDAETQRARVDANRSSGGRPDVVDAVLAEHRATFEAPADDETTVRVEADATRDRETAQRVAEAVRSLPMKRR